jgi:CBS domain-containing protein
MTTPEIADLCEELRESANAIYDDPPFHDREGDPVPPVVDPDKLFDAANTLERQAAEIERLRGALERIAARPVPDGCTDNALIGWISAGAIRKARAALTGEDT